MHPANKALIGVVSTTLLASVALWEGTKYKPYRDIVGVLTVCQGYTGSNITEVKTYTPAECKDLTERVLKVTGKQVLDCVYVPLNQNQYDAFVLFTYNVGAGNFCKSRIAQKLNEKKYTEACKLIATHPNGSPAWSYAGGQYVQGLQNRRKYEVKMCLGDANAKT